MSKFREYPGPQPSSQVASLDGARRAREQKAREAQLEQGARMAQAAMAGQVHAPFPADSPLGHALESAVSQALPHPAPTTDINPKTVTQVPNQKAGE